MEFLAGLDLDDTKFKFLYKFKKIIETSSDVGGSKNNFQNLQIPLNVCMPFILNDYKKIS